MTTPATGHLSMACYHESQHQFPLQRAEWHARCPGRIAPENRRWLPKVPCECRTHEEQEAE